jgi:ribonuclease Z
MNLILLGTNGYHPNERRHTPCLLLPECGVMLDAGTGVYRAAEYLTAPQLDIFLSHGHLDHVIGLTYLFSLVQVHPMLRIVVHGLPEILAAIEEHLFNKVLFPTRPPFEYCALEGDSPNFRGHRCAARVVENGTVPLSVALAGGGRLTYFPLKHRGGSIGFRLDWPGHSMAYVTDTMACPDAEYIERIRGVDLLVHECYFPDAEAKMALKLGHSHTTPVAQLARLAGVKRLALVHFNPLSTTVDPVGLDVAQAIFPNTILGEDRMELEF